MHSLVLILLWSVGASARTSVRELTVEQILSRHADSISNCIEGLRWAADGWHRVFYTNIVLRESLQVKQVALTCEGLFRRRTAVVEIPGTKHLAERIRPQTLVFDAVNGSARCDDMVKALRLDPTALIAGDHQVQSHGVGRRGESLFQTR